MSGVSHAVAPPSEPDQTTTLPLKPQDKVQHGSQTQQSSLMADIMGSLRVIEVQLVAFIMVFTATGLVPLPDFLFLAFTSVYLIALSRLVFPAHGHTTSSQEIFQGSRLFRLYVLVGTAIGMFLPLAYVLGGFARGDQQALQSATPHLFLLSCQILTENVITGLSLFSHPVRALVPLLYTVRRIFVNVDWIHDVWLNKRLPANADFKDIAWHWFGKTLAVANLVYFSINLFCFLIPRFLPRAFERYFRERDEMHGKIAEDKRLAGLKETQPADKKSD